MVTFAFFFFFVFDFFFPDDCLRNQKNKNLIRSLALSYVG